MNVLLISQCTKNALTETRRILDQFAERRGDRTWQTAITQQGLNTLHRLLRQTARKNTAVACHWIRGKDHSELLWIVGDARQFNAQGATPTNITQRNVLRREDENDWHAGEDIRLLARLAALFHDVGKANDVFQKKLKSPKADPDPFRHEWVSLRLFQAFVGDAGNDDRVWLERLLALDGSEAKMILDGLIKDGIDNKVYSPFKTLRLPLARALGWLIVSHHRLPIKEDLAQVSLDKLNGLPRAVTHDWCGSHLQDKKALIPGCWTFKQGLPFESSHWRQHVAKAADAILKRPSLLDDPQPAVLGSPHVLHLSRLVLILADHYYSSQPSHTMYGDKPGKKDAVLYANTGIKDGKRELKQRLDEHLIGVEVNASRLMRTLPRLEQSLPRIARHKKFRERSKVPFRWQNDAFDLAESLRERSAEHGFFGVNMASTGCGKTFANARILYGLANPQQGARFTVALGLRTLTLQTGDAYRNRLHLGEEDFAVLAGGAATKTLHEYYQAKAQATVGEGSESAADLLPDYNHVRYAGSLEDGPLNRWLQNDQRGRKARALLDAPVLVCTIDHLMPACESTRGGHQILPMLRLMTSDLVLDEPDDFDMDDLPALARLVHWAGLLGSRVLLSSATLPPALVQGLFLAYQAGREAFQRHRGRPGARLDICCGWFDEFGAESHSHGSDPDGIAFLTNHAAFVDRRIARLASAKQIRRRTTILPVPVKPSSANDRARQQADICRQLADLLRDQAVTLHRHHHSADPITGKRVSFGLIRMANIDPLFDVALGLYERGALEGCRIHLCAYHARHPTLVRAEIEKQLDAVLKRDRPDAVVFAQPDLRKELDAHPETDHMFIILATAVAEVGRDHCYDWAIVEPSSMRSIIQLAGRVKRHRTFDCPPDQPNILLLDVNVKSLKHGEEAPAFCWPGFESREKGTKFHLRTHRLSQLLAPEQWQVIDARARIRPREPLDGKGNLADLEHARLADLMLGAEAGQQQQQIPVNWWWRTQAHLSGVLQAKTPFRADPQGHQTYYFQPDEDCEKTEFFLLEATGQEVSVEDNLLERLDLSAGPRIAFWGAPDYLTVLQTLAEALDKDDLIDCARRFGAVDLPGREANQRWRYHPALGFSRV
ncbi:MAG: type I-F CRISPR-associated helicase Cas3 [Candidatus Competibacteraceae bacterium]|nr:type I-F CRISPR-associated helicase Cas3 [Candidatus Competibacteraceae bacterium]MCB1920478.1 type I-F CRISPR-associated helicase Cas3 [Candidatus Competibacteraceae bacterium]